MRSLERESYAEHTWIVKSWGHLALKAFFLEEALPGQPHWYLTYIMVSEPTLVSYLPTAQKGGCCSNRQRLRCNFVLNFPLQLDVAYDFEMFGSLILYPLWVSPFLE